jgi:alpha-1,2-mannosyltransferase
MLGAIDGTRDPGESRVRSAAAALLPARLRPLLAVAPQLSRYAVVSLVALALDFAVFLAFTSASLLRPSLAGVAGYAAGMSLHYLLAIAFVFDARATDKHHARLFGEFALTGLGGMGVTALVIAVATGVGGLTPLTGKVLAAGASFIVVFALRRMVVFAARRAPAGGAGDAACLRALGQRLGQVASAWFHAVNRRQPHADFYAKFTVAGATFLAVLEVAYFAVSDPPSFWMPSVDAFGGTAIGRDFLNAWVGGRSALGQGPAQWFDFRAYNDYLHTFVPVTETYFWSYPPHVLLLLWPLGLLPYLPAFLLWTLAGFAVFLWAARTGGVERRHLLFVAVAPAVAVNVFIGQNGFFTAALLIAGLASLDRRPLLSGALFGILTIKPQLGLLLPVMLVMTGRWRVIAAAAVTAAGLVAATAWIYGPDIWTEYLAKVVPQQRLLQEYGEGLVLRQVPSAFCAARLVGLSIGTAWALQLLVSAAAAAAVAWTYWRRRDPVLSASLLVVAVFLASPYTLNYDMVVLGALLRQRADNEPVDHYLIIALWTLPATMVLVGLANIPIAFPLLAAFAARIVWRLVHGEAREPFLPMLGAPTRAA